MAVREFTDPDTGLTLSVEGEGTPSEAELTEMFRQASESQGQGQAPQRGSQRAPQPTLALAGGRPQPTQEEFEEPGNFLGDLIDFGESFIDTAISTGKQALGTAEAATSIITGGAAEVPAGLTGAAVSLVEGPEAGEEAIKAVREQLTFQPRSDIGKERIKQAGGLLAPVGEALQKAEKFLGDKTFEATGSPTLSAAATTIPTAILELAGVKGTKTLRNVRAAKKNKIINKQADQLIRDAAHSTDELRAISSGVFKEIDNLGASVNPNAFGKFSNELSSVIAREGLDPDVTPGSFKAIQRIQQALPDPVTGLPPKPITLSEIDTLRNVAQNAAGSTTNLRDARLGVKIVDAIDEFIDQADTAVLNTPDGVDVAKRYQVARGLWGQAKRGEMIGEALAKAERAGSSLENNIRNKFRQIIDNKSKSKFFSKSELAQMEKVVKGDKSTNLFTLLGKLGPSDSGKGIIGLSIGVAGGSAIAGGPGAVFVPFLGWLSKRQATRMTKGAADFADAVVRAGKDSQALARAYIKNTPKSLRDPGDFAAILINGGASLADLPKSKFMTEAAQIAQQRKLALRDILATGGAAAQAREQANQPTGAR